MADELNIPTHRWYQKRNHIALAKEDVSRQYIFDSGIQKIDAFIALQPWGNPIPPLFANDEPGVWYDPSDLDTLFQDTAGTIPVTTAGQTVARMNDRSGNGYHATQPTAAARPTYQTDGTYHWLSFDGVDDFMVTPTITPGIDKAQVFAGVRKLSDAATALLVEISPSMNSNNGAFYIGAPGSSGQPGYAFATKGTIQSTAFVTAGYESPVSSVVSGLSDISGDRAILRIDGTQVDQKTSDQGTGNYLAYPMYIGRRGGTSLPFNGNIYSLVTRFGANLETGTIETTETYVAGKTGVDL